MCNNYWGFMLPTNKHKVLDVFIPTALFWSDIFSDSLICILRDMHKNDLIHLRQNKFYLLYCILPTNVLTTWKKRPISFLILI